MAPAFALTSIITLALAPVITNVIAYACAFLFTMAFTINFIVAFAFTFSVFGIILSVAIDPSNDTLEFDKSEDLENEANNAKTPS